MAKSLRAVAPGEKAPPKSVADAAATGTHRDLLVAMLAEVGARDEREFAVRYPALPDERKRRLAVLDPRHTTSSTPREITRLLRLIWTDAAGPPDEQRKEVVARDEMRLDRQPEHVQAALEGA
mgnify:CR=1 FL=1